MRVLLVDDNLANREVGRHLLRADGHEVRAVDNGFDSLADYGQERFDLVLMDISMPGMCGMETTLRMRLKERVDWRPPIIALTAYFGVAERALYADVGLDAVLSKPLNVGELDRAVAEFRPRQTVNKAWVARQVEREGLEAVARGLSEVLRQAASLASGASPSDLQRAALRAQTCGLEALSARCATAARAPGLWTPLCLAAVHHEVLAAQSRLRSRPVAAPSLCRDARSA